MNKSLKWIFSKIKEQKASVSVETALVVIFVLPVVLGLIATGFLYSSSQSENINLNFDAGRYIANNGCSLNGARKMSELNEWRNFNIILYINEEIGGDVYEGNGGGIVSYDEGARGTVELHCPANSDRGNEFIVKTIVKIPTTIGHNIFNASTSRIGHYTQELQIGENFEEDD